MKSITASIKAYTLNPNPNRLFGNRLTHQFSALLVATFAHLATQSLTSRIRRNKRRPSHIIYNLGVNVTVRTKYRKPWPLRSPKNLLSNMMFTPQCCFLFTLNHHKQNPMLLIIRTFSS
jgi:hypothetical protein